MKIIEIVFLRGVYIVLMLSSISTRCAVDYISTCTAEASALRLNAPRIPRPTSTVAHQQSFHVSNERMEARDAVFRRLDVDLLVAKKQIIQTDLIVTGTFFTGSIVSSGPISGPSLAISGPATVGSLTAGNAVINHATITTLEVTNPIVGNLSGASSLNVLKAGDTMTGQLRINSSVGAAAVLRGLGTTQTPALQLLDNPTATNTDAFLAIDSSGNVTQTVSPVQVGMLANATSGNVPSTLVQRDALGSFEANALRLQGLDVVGASTFRDRMYLLFQNVSPNNILYVQKSAITAPNQFNSIKAAMDTITTSSANNPFVIRVTPGVYVEDTITMKPYTSIRGDTQGATIIEASSPTNDIIVACDNTFLRNFTMRGATGSGKAAISIDGGHLVVDMVKFGSSDEFVKVRATSSPCSVILLNSEADSTVVFSTAFDIQSTAGLQCGLITRNIFWSSTTPLPAGLTIIKDSGPGAFFIGSTLVLGNSLVAPTPGSGTKYLELSNGASAALGISLLRGFDVGISVPATSTGPLLVLQGVVGSNNNIDISVQDQQTQGSIMGVFSQEKIIVDPAVRGLSVLITEPSNGGIDMVGPVFTGHSLDTMANVSPLLNEGATLGVIDGGFIYTTTASLVVTVSAGHGYLTYFDALHNQNDLAYVSWATTTTTLPTGRDSFLYINKEGQLQTSLAQPPIFSTIPLGKVRANSMPLFTEAIPQDAGHTATQLTNAFIEAFGPIYVSGSVVVQNGATGLNVSQGKYVYGTHIFEPVGASPLSWQAYLGAGTNSFVTTQTAVDYQQFDSGGVLTPIPPSAPFAKHLLYVIGGVDSVSGAVNEQYALVYSQTTFATLEAAVAGSNPTQPSTWSGNIVPLASLIVTNSTSVGIVRILDQRPFPSFAQTAALTAATVHGNLFGLLADDHPQYLLTNGGRAMSGNLQMGANQITNVGQINGVTIQTHASRHLPGSVADDPLPMGVPVTIGTANSLSQSGGVVNNFAYSDHVHAHGAQTDATLHAVATTVAAGFMSSADKQLLTNATPSNTPNTLVLRDAQGNFAAGAITAGLLGDVTGNVVGNVSGAASANVLKIGDTMTGQLRISDAINSALVLSTNTTNPTASITGNGTTQAPALRLMGTPNLSIIPKLIADATGSALGFDTTGYALTVDVTGNVMKSLGNNGDSFRTFFSQPNWYQPVDPRRELVFYDDFTGALVAATTGLPFGETNWKWDVGGGASAITGPTPIGDAFGIVRLTVTNNANAFAIIAKNITTNFGTLYFGLGKFVAEMRVYVDQSNTGYSFRVGYGNLTFPPAAPTDFTYGVYFEYTPATSANWLCKTVNGGGPTTATSSVAVVPGTWYKLRIEVSADGTQVNYYINNELQTGAGFPITTTIPVTSAAACGPVAYVSRNAAIANPSSANIDYWYHQYVFTKPR